MSRLSDYYHAVRAKREELSTRFPEGYLFISDLEHKRASQVSVDNGAARLTDGSHRESTPCEIAELESIMNEQRAVIASTELRHAGQWNRLTGVGSPSGLPALSVSVTTK